MWKFLYRLASPRTFYVTCKKLDPILFFVSTIFLVAGIIWSLFIAPADYQQGEAYRIIYFHVPCAFLSINLYGFMGFLAFLLLVWRIKIAGIMLLETAYVGASLTFVALISGSLWGKPMWGSFWVWDARLTSELILLLFYCVIIATYHSVLYKNAAIKICAIITLVGLIDLPIIHYSVSWWNTLHQGSTISIFKKPQIAPAMLYPLIVMLIGTTLFSYWIIFQRSVINLLENQSQQNWLKQLRAEGRL